MRARALRQSSEFEARMFEQVVVERFTSRFLSLAMGMLERGDVEVRGAAHVLDLGCGTGAASFALLSHLGSTCRVVGVDADEGLLSHARKVGWETYGQRLNFVQQSVEDLQFEDSSFELVVANCLLGNDLDEEAVLSEVRRVLVPGGAVILTRPLQGTFFEVLETMMEVAESWDDAAMMQRVADEKRRFPSESEFVKQVKRIGFNTVRSQVSEFRLSFRTPAEIFRDDLIAHIATASWGRAAGPRGERAFDGVVEFMNNYLGVGRTSLGIHAGVVAAVRT